MKKHPARFGTVSRSIVLGLNHIKEGSGVPDELSINDLTRGANQISNQCDYKVGNREVDKVSSNDIDRLSRVALEISHIAGKDRTVRSS